MYQLRLLAATALVAIALLALACSPEDGRKRGQPGADIGNKPDSSAEVEFHGKKDPDAEVPRAGEAIRKQR
jgi:hypothetical protein